MIWTAFGILALFVGLLYAWVWHLSTCHNQLSRIVRKDETPPRTRKDETPPRTRKDETPPSPVESKPTFISEKWSYELKPKKIRPCRSRKRTARKTKGGKAWKAR